MQIKNEILESEIRALRREVADLSSELLRFQSLRLIGIFNKYRLLRSRISKKIAQFLGIRTITTNVRWKKYNRALSIKVTPRIVKYDVIFMSCADWQWRYQRPQHLTTMWAENGHRVFYVVPKFQFDVNPSYLKPSKRYTAKAIFPGVFEIYLSGPSEMQPLNRRMLLNDAEELVASFELLREDFDIQNAICIMELPFWGTLSLMLKESFGWKLIYDYIDRWYGVFPKSHSMLVEETALLTNVDAVVATARLLKENAEAFNTRAFYIPNAADFEHFYKAADKKHQYNLFVKSPRIGYIGNLANWFDDELVQAVATRRPEWIISLIGSGPANMESLSRLENVNLVGEVPYESLPSYLCEFDLCIIPFKLMPVTAVTDPVKFYEYLAAGKPVVATNLPELRPYDEFVYLANNPTEFEELINVALMEDNEAKKAQRIEFARRNTWEHRFKQYHEIILDILENPSKTTNKSNTDEGVNKKSSISTPFPIIFNITPSAIRHGDKCRNHRDESILLRIRGKFLKPTCVVYVDENPIISDFVDETEIRCLLPAYVYSRPGCLMISVMDHNTWKQSNRRVLLIEGV